MSIAESHAYVLAEAKANIEFVRADRHNVKQAHEVNTALANIVTMERNIIMDKAIELSIKKDEAFNLPEVRKSEPSARPETDAKPVPRVLERLPEAVLGGNTTGEGSGLAGELR